MKRKLLLSPLSIIIMIIVFGIGVTGAIYFGNSGTGGDVNLQKGLMGWWKLDGNAKDDTPYGNNGTVAPAACVSGDTDNGDGTCTATFYPNPDPESTSVDGLVGQDYSAGSGQSWATIVAGSGTVVDSMDSNRQFIIVWADSGSNKWRELRRGIFLFDTSSLPDNSSISSATLSIYGSAKSDATGTAPDVNIYSANPASNTDLVAADYATLGTTAFSTAISYAGWSTSGYNAFVLNSSGLSAISKTGVSKFGARNANYDASGTPPTWNSLAAAALSCYLADTSGTSQDPKLVVVYAKPGPAVPAPDRKGATNKAYSFNGTNNYIDAGSGSNLSITGALTLGGWVKIDQTSSGSYMQFFGKGENFSGSKGMGYALGWEKATSRVYYNMYNDTVKYELAGAAATITDSNWHYVAVTWDGTTGANGVKMYIDGALKLQDTSTISAITYSYPVTKFTIGARSVNLNLPTAGYIDDVRVYSRALSQAEITALYDQYSSGIVISDLQKGLVGQWKMGGNAKDSSPYGNNGTVSGATLTTDRKGQTNKAYGFDGVNNYITVPTQSYFMQTPMSVELWVKLDNLASLKTVDQTFFRKSHSVSPWASWTVYQSSTNDKVFFAVCPSSGSCNYDCYSDSALATGVWYHIVGTIDGSYNMKIYVNSVLQAHTGNLGMSMFSSDGTVRIGGNATQYPTTGSIDDVRIYNRALSQSEVTSLYDSYNSDISVSSLQKGLVGWWNFNGNVKDSTPYGNNGTVSGATLDVDRKGQTNKAYSFNGTSDYISTTRQTYNLSTGTTIAFWLKLTDTANLRYIMGDSSTAFYKVIYFEPAGDPDKIYLETNTNEDKCNGYLRSPTTADTNWHHFTLTVVGNVCQFYEDGQAMSMPDTSVSDNIDLNQIGKGGTNNWQGSIDDVRIYNRALSATEAQALYESY
jgi:hypothetical protein